jgi:DNA topoisomerase-1
VKKLEEEGIGRPSTYAPVISTIQQRGYIKKDGSQLVPEEVAFTVTDLLVAHFPDIADLTFTAQMEQSLDTIAEGGSEWKEFLAAFYGPFHELITRKGQEIKKEDVLKERIIGTDPATGLPVLVRAGRFGPYLQLGKPPPKEPGVKRKTGELQKWKTASLPKNLTADGVTLEQALGLLVFPRDIGIIDGETLTVQSGRFGPYLKCGSTTVSLPEGYDPATLTLEQAKEAMSAASEKRKKAAEPLRTLGTDPATGAAIQVKDGRFGPYVSDGKTNASLGKKFDASAITLEEAAELLAKKRLAPKRAWGRKKK